MAARDLASRLRERITIEAPDLIPNGKGGRSANPVTGGWAEVAKPWAELIPLRGDEALRLGVERRTQLWRITVRYREDVTPAHRILHADVTIDIKAVAPDRAGGVLVLTGESGA